jgi:hypothetical protein
MQVKFVYCDLRIYWRSAVIFCRSFDKVITLAGAGSDPVEALYDLKSVKAIFCGMISGHPVHPPTGGWMLCTDISPFSEYDTVMWWEKEELSTIHGATKKQVCGVQLEFHIFGVCVLHAVWPS